MSSLDAIGSTNINSLWLNNIFENLKNLENMERNAREGCANLMEYLGIPMSHRGLVIADTQYKNLRFIVTEMGLLLTDVTPVFDPDKLKEYLGQLEKVDKVIDNRKLFVKENYSATKNSLVNSRVTEFFNQTLIYMVTLRRQIIREISHLLYVEDINSKRNKKPEILR